jgi:hypothetical protein
MKRHKILFDDYFLKQISKTKNNNIKNIISNLLDKLEVLGPLAGKLLDSKLQFYELKNKKPAIRIYFKVSPNKNIILIGGFEIKKSKGRQNKTIDRIKDLFRYLIALWCRLFLLLDSFQIL